MLLKIKIDKLKIGGIKMKILFGFAGFFLAWGVGCFFVSMIILHAEYTLNTKKCSKKTKRFKNTLVNIKQRFWSLDHLWIIEALICVPIGIILLLIGILTHNLLGTPLAVGVIVAAVLGFMTGHLAS
ncbi:hypothetical protein CL633_00530 [bacterium]|nr:hypothetical protein [bacterium]